MKRILHLGYDDKFYPGVIYNYKGIEGISNRFLAYKTGRNAPLTYLAESEDLCIIHKKNDLIAEICKGDYDVIMVHSLNYYYWDVIRKIPRDKIFIWVSYGYDIYSPGPFGVDYKLIQIDSLLPITKKVYNKTKPFIASIKYNIAHCILSIRWRRYGCKIVKRVDYFQPVFHLEYEMLRKLSIFNAKEYYPPMYNPRWGRFSDKPKKGDHGAIQLCNSAGEYGNHLDAWEAIKNHVPSEQEIIMPLSYGVKSYANYVKDTIKKEHHITTVLEDFVPREEYFEIINRSTYFVHGAIRQHAMANIYNAIATGRKVFLFKDSVIYKYLTDIGCIIFPIEEVDENSFKTPLSLEEHNINVEALRTKILKRREMGKTVFNDIFHNEIDRSTF